MSTFRGTADGYVTDNVRKQKLNFHAKRIAIVHHQFRREIYRGIRIKGRMTETNSVYDVPAASAAVVQIHVK